MGHSIGELTLHIAAWIEAAERRIGGDPALLLGDADWPPFAGSWEAAQERLRASTERLIDATLRADLTAAVPGKAYDVYFLLHGVIQHALYHAGQIAVAKRAGEGMLRHAVATVRYRAAKTLVDPPENFGSFSLGQGTRTPAELLAHLGDLFSWIRRLADGDGTWIAVPSQGWEADEKRFWAELEAVEQLSAMAAPVERLLQGPVADALTHVGQLAMLRRLAGAPISGENYFRAKVVS